MITRRLVARVDALVAAPQAFFDDLRLAVAAGARLVTLIGRPGDQPDDAVLTAVLADPAGLRASRTTISRERGYHALTPDLPAAHIFERELHEQLGVRLPGHPWLKPVRRVGRPDGYPFYRITGKEVHEVAVGPIHAGVIEPGHFRFMCLGEIVHHLEIQLGYQHRGAEALLLARDPRTLAPLVETIAGDSSIAHAWAYADALEGLAGQAVDSEVERSRAIGLELERVAMHLAGLAGLAADVAFLPGAATYGRLRTTAINASMRLCGSRLGRGWVRPGGVRAAMPATLAPRIKDDLALLGRDLPIINDHLRSARSVRHRLDGVGVVTGAQALELGLVGLAARASGVALDRRASLPGSIYTARPIATVVEPAGDCWARAELRLRELDASLAWLGRALDDGPPLERAATTLGELRPGGLSVAVVEGWRGEVVHCLETDAGGALRHYKVQDPSLRNWMGLALAMRGGDISDFPICNKSFDLSYCGNDL